MAEQYIPGHSGHREKKKFVGAGAALGLAFALLVILIGTAIGRYQHQFTPDASVKAKDFYFTSDFLDGNTHTLAPGTTEVSFTLGNHADELRWSEVDITYAVTVTPADGTASEDVTVEYSDSGKKFTAGSKQDATVTIKGLQPGTYTVTAAGNGGYEKSLTATIEVLSNEAQVYYHQGIFAEYTLLTVWNEGDKPGEVTITYTGIPDNTNPNMTDWTTNGDRTVTVKAHESLVFRFFGGGTVGVTGAEQKTPS